MNEKERLFSLDALRGADMLFIMGLSGLIATLAKMWGCPALAEQMHHVEWIGFAHHDTIFPTFLFIAGVSWPFSYASQVAKGATTAQIVRRIFKRAALLFLCGLVYNELLDCKFAHVRIPGVLQFIALSWMFAALLTVFVRKIGWRIALACVLLLGYGSLLAFFEAPDAVGKGSFSYEGNIAGWLDRTFLSGHILGRCDPESSVSVLCGTCTALFGVFAGEIVRFKDWSGGRKALALAALSLGLLVLGFAAQPFCPCIKKLWTPTFALFAGAYASGCFALFYFLCDVLQWRAWTFPFRVIGMNAIAIYLAQRIVNFHHTNTFLFKGICSFLPHDPAVALSQFTYILVCWFFLYALYRKNVFLKV